MTDNRPAERFLEDKRPTGTLAILAAPHSYDGSSYYRIWLPFKNLEAAQHHLIRVYDPRGGPIALDLAARFDVMVLQRPAGVMGKMLLEQLAQLAGQTRLIYEVDDDMLNVDPAGLPHLAAEQARESIRRCLRLCDMVTVTNEYLADTVRPYNDNIVILPNFVKAGLLDMRPARKPDRTKTVVGWAGGDTHGWDIEEVRGPLRHLVDTMPDVDIHFIGKDHSPITGRDCRWTMWQPDVGHYYKNIDFDIAIAPSADRMFNRSKTPIRALEMAALGIPIVASNRLPYSEFVVDGKTGFLVDDDAGWVQALRLLIRDPELRQEMGDAAREQAAGWTIEENWQLWQAAYEKAAGG